MPMGFANRTSELRFFAQMLGRQTTERIFLIEAPTGYGKTNLLLQFESRCPSGTMCALVDLKSATAGIAYLFSRIRRRIGVTHFPYFDAVVIELLRSSGVQIENNQLWGQDNQLQVILNVPNYQLPSFRLVQLREAFFQDLQQLSHPVLLILDTFNEATEELAQWIGGEFLADVADTSNVFVVLAGQRVPPLSGEWSRCAHCRPLDLINDLEAWYEYAMYKGLPLNRDKVEMVVFAREGVPAEIVKTFEAYSRQQL